MLKGLLPSRINRRFTSVLLIGLLLLAGCNKNDDKKKNDSQDSDNLGLFEWDRSPDTIILRMDDQANYEPQAYFDNDIPLCTLWGDGRLVWVNLLSGRSEVLEARLTDDQIRGLIETIIRTGFYDWENDIVPPGTDNPVLQSLTLNLFDSSQTVERYSPWPANGFATLFDTCANLAETRASVLPTGGWMKAYEVEVDQNAKVIPWPRTAPFTLAELASSGTPRWIETPWAEFIWTNVTRESGSVQVREEGKAYLVSLQVPGISRDAPPAPES
ncbi:MAG: hypothetical protein HY862_19270 [Chloroflexi bacterium]|nr:hypothetical protein [Chloroflexota bacterium]